jgi:metallo-beta-lactamase family protein
MLGSTSVILDIEDQETKKDVRLVFSGDIGRKGLPIIRDPEPITDGCDVLIMESTYGNRLHEPYQDAEEALETVINETYKRGGVVIIPAFSVGRTQQIVYALHRLYNQRDIPAVPIYVDSPLATNVTEVFRLHPETYDAEIRDFLLKDDDRNPFGFQTLHYTRSVEESKELNFLRDPAVIISASGMMEAGRVLHHLRNRIEDPRTTILVVGWQAPNTLGRRIVEKQDTVKIFGEEHHLRAQVVTLDGFSGHADRNELLAWAGAMQKKPARTFLVHGELESANALASGLMQEVGLPQVNVPALHDSVEV